MLVTLPFLLIASTVASDPTKGLGPPEIAISTPNGWRLDLHSDGSAYLKFRDQSGIGHKAPAGTFQIEKLRKAFEATRPNARVRVDQRTHYHFYFDSERKLSPEKPPPSHFTQDETLVVPLFQKAAEVARVADSINSKALKEFPFALTSEQKRFRVFAFATPGSWFLDVNNDGSGHLQFGSNGGDGCSVPERTFDVGAIRKMLETAPIVEMGHIRTHIAVWVDENANARYLTQSKELLSLFEKAADAGKLKDKLRGKQLLTERPFGRE